MLRIKSIVVGAVCLILVCVSIIISYNPQRVFVRKGMGINAEIYSIPDMSNMIKSINNFGSIDVNKSTVSVSAADDLYYSMTFAETTDSYFSSKSNYNKDDVLSNSTSTSSFRRKLQIAYDRNAVYYYSVGQLSFSSTSISNNNTYYSETQSRIYSDFAVHIYLDNNNLLIKADKFDYSNYKYYKYTNYKDGDHREETNNNVDDMLKVMQDNSGKWLNCTSAPEIAEAIIEVNENNGETLGDLGDFLTNVVESDNNYFEQNSNIYILKQEMLSDFVETFLNGYGESSNGMLMIDLSDSQSPSVSIDISASNIESSSSSRLNSYASFSDVMDFSNINNTEILLDENINAIDISELLTEVA